MRIGNNQDFLIFVPYLYFNLDLDFILSMLADIIFQDHCFVIIKRISDPCQMLLQFELENKTATNNTHNQYNR